jgi:hypothetical protein
MCFLNTNNNLYLWNISLSEVSGLYFVYFQQHLCPVDDEDDVLLHLAPLANPVAGAK